MKLKVRKYIYEEKNFWEVYPPKQIAKTVISIFLVVFLVLLSPFIVIPQIDNLITPFEDRIPANYYTSQNTTKTFSDLTEFLDDFSFPRKLEWFKTFDKFDCSESSAYLEYKLEESGFDAAIAIGNHHAWVIVRNITKNNETRDYAIEATTLAISHYKARYRSHSDIYEDIYEAIDGYHSVRHRYYEFNWWDGVEGDI